MQERANIATDDPLLFWKLVTRRRAEQALRREAAFREVMRQGGQVRIYFPGETAPEATKANRRARRKRKWRRLLNRIFQRLTVAGLIAVILLLAFAIGVEIGTGKRDNGGGEAPPTAAANEWRHDNG